MGLIKKLVVAGVVITVATGSIAWINTAVNVGSYATEKIVQSGILDDAAEYIKTKVEEKYLSEDGTTIVIPVSDIESLIDTISSYVDIDALQEAAEEYGIDIEAIASGDFSSVSDYINGDELSVSAEKFTNWLSSLAE